MSKAPLDEAERTGRPEGKPGRERRQRSFLGSAVGRLRAVWRAFGDAVRSGVAGVFGPSSGRTESASAPSSRSSEGRSTKPAQYALVSDGTDGDPASDPAADPASGDRADATVRAADDALSGSDRADATIDDGPGETSVVPADDAPETDRDGPDHDRPDLDAQWHGDELTIQSPDDPDARITSDVWEDVER